MEIIAKLGSLLGLSFVSGINLYATVGVVGLVTKFNLIQGLPPEFQALNNNLIITVAIILYACEFLADKIPGFDTAWDAIHTVIRPFGGALLALMTVGKASPGAEVLAFMIGATMATGSHLAKSGFRVLINTSPEPFSNMVVSVAEDMGVVGLAYLSMAHPVLALIITVILTIIIIIVLPFLWRAILMLLSGLWHRLKSVSGSSAEQGAKSIAIKIASQIGDAGISLDNSVVVPAWVIKMRGFKRWQKGYLVCDDKNLYFMPSRMFKKTPVSIPRPNRERILFGKGFLFHKVFVNSDRESWNFIVPRNYAKLLEEHLV
ncbi:MAG TPA: DUF4126 domain-containing protein [Deltaproteobacteria bacterium]|nr:DUF4126 domain-containing protein [Deltaproteobacteria bacterium]